LDTGSPMTVTMKVSRMGADSHHIIIGISIKDAALTEHRGL
jgi:hypothetical protein